MGFSKVMASTSSTPNSDLTHQLPFPIPSDLQPDQPTTSSTTTTATSMDDLLNIYGDCSSSNHPHISASPLDAAGDIPARGVAGSGMDEGWKEAEMTLEDFLTRTAGAVRDEEMGIPAMPPPPQCFGAAVNATSSMISGGGGVGFVAGVAVGNGQFQSSLAVEGFANSGGIGGGGEGGGGGGGGVRAKRRAVEEPAMDKATQQKQRRMINNRESAARSRERKQSYTVELESLVVRLEEENARLQNEEAQETRERLKQLMENVILITEKRRPPPALRRVNSMVW